MDSGADEFDVHTLDYLGLDDGHRHPPAATISELRNQAQAAIAGNLATHPSRMRATTVSNPYHLRAPGVSSLLSTPNAEEEDMYDEIYRGAGLDSYESPDAGNYLSSGYMPKGFKHSDHLGVPSLGNRPRAISVGNLDDTSRALHRRTAEAQQAVYNSEISLHAGLGGSGSLTPAGILRSDKVGMRNTASPTVHFPNGELAGARSASYLAAPNTQARAVSPKSESSSTQMQTPTRSLWIGNLDSSVTSEQLIHVFAPYGAIESLRLLPEKVSEAISTRE